MKLPRLILILGLGLGLFSGAVCAQEDFVPAGVRDISDRAYEAAVIGLLDGAKESIVISMYNISVTENEKDPVKFLVKDLLEARERGVEVTLNINTRFKGDEEGGFKLVASPLFGELKKAGCRIHLMPLHRRLHDKLIIVDRRYVVEASTNWSTSALKTNCESATLIDSPGLAAAKLLRLERLINEPEPAPDDGEPRRALYLEGLPAEIGLSEALLSEKGYLPRMVTKQDQRGMLLYLLLLAHSQTAGEKEFFINLEAMGLSLGIPDTWRDAKIRQHVMLALRRLMREYKLISAEFYHDKDARIEMADVPGGSFAAPSFVARPDSGISLAARFLLIVKSYLEARGEDINSISGRELARRFKVSRTTVNYALKELMISE